MNAHDINQIDLIAAIAKHLEKRHRIKEVIPRHFNAVIAAADLIVTEFRKPEVLAEPNSGLHRWLASDDTGVSSLTMAHYCVGAPKPRYESHPHDSGDFGRCVRLIEAVPIVREYIGNMRNVSPEWQTLVDHWGELEALYRGKSNKELCARINELVRQDAEAANG